jgi:hypothetical protein
VMTFYTHPVAIEAEAFREWQGHVRSELAVAGRCYSMIDVDARGCRALAQAETQSHSLAIYSTSIVAPAGLLCCASLSLPAFVSWL